MEVGRKPCVAIVKANRSQPASYEFVTEALMPAEHLRAHAHNQQHGRRVSLREALVCYLDFRRADVESLLHTHRRILSPAAPAEDEGETLRSRAALSVLG